MLRFKIDKKGLKITQVSDFFCKNDPNHYENHVNCMFRASDASHYSLIFATEKGISKY